MFLLLPEGDQKVTFVGRVALQDTSPFTETKATQG